MQFSEQDKAEMKQVMHGIILSLPVDELVEIVYKANVLAEIPMEKRLEGLSLEQRILGLSAEDRERLLQLLQSPPAPDVTVPPSA